jgi:hypothetical protein
MLALAALAPTAAFAATTGSISGVVRGTDGSPLPGVTVTVSGPALPAGRSAITDGEGAFRILRLPPGDYEATAEVQGMGNVKRQVAVAVEADTQLSLVLNPTIQEEMTVQEVAPIIDIRSSEAQVNFTRQMMEQLPLTRSYKGLFQLAPGVSENGRLAPNAGGSRMDNLFLIDGINVTNPHYGDILPNISELDVAEVNIKRGGVTAEFGRTGGMVVNAVTKSGGNDVKGEGRFEYQPASFVAANKNSTIKNTTDQTAAAAALGGPVMHDRLWFYASGNFPDTTTTDRRNSLGAVPDEKLSTDEYFGKLTANPSSSQFLAASYRHRKSTDENAGITSSSSPTVGSNDFTKYTLATFDWTWNTTADSFAELRLNHDKEENGTNPVDGLGYRPAFNPARPDLVGQFTTTPDILVGGANRPGQTVGGATLAVNDDNFSRDELRATFQLFRGWGKSRHDLRGGITYETSDERLERRANGWGTVTWSPTTRQFTASYVSQQPPHTGRGTAYGAFAQDQITLGDRLTITAGVLVNKDDYFGEGLGSTPGTKTKVKILSFGWGQQIQPRLGLAYVPSAERGDKVYFNFGRYYNTENKSLGRAASPTRIFTTRATFDAAGNLLSDVPAANTQSKTIDKGLDPQYTDEVLAGYARPLQGGWTAEIWGMYRNTGNIFEDESADGLGHGPFHVAQLPHAYRKYKAVTLQATRRPIDDRLMHLFVDFSYTWSRLSGNWDIDFGANSPFYNSSFIQDGPGVLITDNRDGLLRGDRTHVAKLFATVRPLEHLRIGTYVRYQSGGAWEARGLPDPTVSSSSFIRYLEPAGSRRMPSWLNVDLLTSYDFRLGPIGLTLEGKVTNLFDDQTELAVDDRLIAGGTFGQGTVFSAPRAFVLSALVRY